MGEGLQRAFASAISTQLDEGCFNFLAKPRALATRCQSTGSWTADKPRRKSGAAEVQAQGIGDVRGRVLANDRHRPSGPPRPSVNTA